MSSKHPRTPTASQHNNIPSSGGANTPVEPTRSPRDSLRAGKEDVELEEGRHQPPMNQNMVDADDTERDALSGGDVFPTLRSAIMFGGAADADYEYDLRHHDHNELSARIGSKRWFSNFRLGLILFMTMTITILFALVIALIIVVNISMNGKNPTQPISPWSPPTIDSGTVELISAKYGATAADSEVCSKIGTSILKDLGGNAVDAAVATGFCIGIMNPFSAGIGGGGIMAISKPRVKDNLGNASLHELIDNVEYIDYREKAPNAASWDMYSPSMTTPAPPSQRGGKSIAVLSEVKGLYTAWKRYGSLPWRKLVEPSIDLARTGVKANYVISKHLQRYKDWIIKNTFGSGMSSIYGDGNGDVKKEGDLIQFSKLADTLEKIADGGADAIYSPNGTLFNDIVDDIKSAGGIITVDDLLNYSVNIYSTDDNSTVDPLSTYFLGYRVFGPRPEISGGSCIIFMLNMLESYVKELQDNTQSKGEDFHMSSKKYALFVEALKFAFAHRSELGDPAFVPTEDMIKKMTSKEYAGLLRQYLDSALENNRTFLDPLHYKNEKLMQVSPDDHGTSHLNVVDKNGMAVSMTTTINLIFGSFVVGEKTGILFNDQMDDFSLPNTTNYFGLAPSPSNYIAPGKRPLSSMSPMIIHKNNKFYMSIGASGGSRIISSVFQSIWNHMVEGLNIAQSIQYPRIHHQWSPEKLSIEKGIPDNMVSFLTDYMKGGTVESVKGNAEFSVGVVQGIVKTKEGEIYAASDIRKQSKASGY